MSNIQQIEEQIDKIQNNNMKLFEIFQTVMELPENKKPETLKVTPTKEYQEHRGLYNVVTVDGDENLVSENIKEGTSIFGVEGSAKTTDIKITDASYLFYKKARLDYFNEFLSLCENITSTDSMFYNCNTLTSLDLTTLDTSKVTNMKDMFNGCNKLVYLNVSNFDTSNVIYMNSIFTSCSKLTELDLSNFDTSNVIDMGSVFSGFGNSTTENISIDISNFNMEKVQIISYCFGGVRNLVNLKFGTNLGKGYTQKSENYNSYKLDLSACTKLTHESLMSVINNLYDLNLTYSTIGDGTLYRQGLVLGSTNLAKLTAEEIAIATNKGWNVT